MAPTLCAVELWGQLVQLRKFGHNFYTRSGEDFALYEADESSLNNNMFVAKGVGGASGIKNVLFSTGASLIR